MRALTVLAFILSFLSLPAAAQVGFGTLLQSIDSVQPGGSGTLVGLQGNPSVTTNEVIAWSSGEANGRARSLFNAQALGLLFGDRNGDGNPFDWPDIDAIEVSAPQPGVGQPSPYDFRFSFANDVLGPGGSTVVNTGDIIQLTGIGTYAITIPRGAFQAALGTSTALNVDGYAEMADGAVLVSFKTPSIPSTGTNIVNPLNGNTGSAIQWFGTDVFIIRQPFGSLPAIIAYRKGDSQTELHAVVNFYYGNIPWTDVAAIEVQPPSPGYNGAFINNPWDPTNLYQGGTRPPILWTINDDENVFNYNNTWNPLSQTHNFYAIVGNGSQSNAGYTTNAGTNRIVADALAIWSAPLTTNTRLTLDVNSLTPAGGTNLTVTVRGLEAAGTRFQILLGSVLGFGQGINAGAAGFRWFVLSPADPLVYFSLDPIFSPFFLTGGTDAVGTASTIPIPIPNGISGLALYFQAFENGTPFELTSPLMIRIL